MTGDSPWTFTFCDMRTGRELAVLPLTGVSYARAVRDVGSVSAYLPLTDQRVRNLNPWAATRPRRVALYIEHEDTCVWGGPITGRPRKADSQGLELSGVTWEGWLHRQRLLTDLELFAAGTGPAVAALVTAAQATTPVGMTVAADGPDGAEARDQLWLAREVKPVLELLEGLGEDTEVPLEFTVDCARDGAGIFRPTLRWGAPRIGRRYEDTPIEFGYPEGGLLGWTLDEDGSGADNVLTVLGSGSGDAQPFDVLLDAPAGADELASGFPTWMGDYKASDTDDLDVALARAGHAMRAGLAGELVIADVLVDPARYLGRVGPGDDLSLQIAHLSLEEWPDPATFLARVLGESVTVGDGGAGDKVQLTVGAIA